MLNKDKQFYIYLRSTKERVPVTEQEFKDYYRDINSFRKRQERHGKCVCPSYKRLDCDMDCETCPFRRAGDSLSLNYTVTDDEGNEKPWLDDLADDKALFEDIISDEVELNRLFSRITEIMPQAIEIGILRQSGLTERNIEQQIGVPRKTTSDRIKRLKKILEKEFPEFF